VPAVPPGTHAVKGSEEVKTAIPSVESAAGEAGQLDAARRQQEAEGTIGEEQAKTAAAKAQAQAEAYQAAQVKIQADQQAEADRRAAVQKQHDDEWAQLSQDAKSKPALFGNTTALEGVLGLASVLGAAFARGSNAPGRGGWGAIAGQALGLVTSHIDRAYQQHAAEIQERYKELTAKDGYNENLARQAQTSYVDARAQQAQAYLHAGDFIDAQAKALGTPEAAANAAKIKAEWDAKIGEIRAKAGVAQNVNVTTTTKFSAGKGGAGGGGNDLAQVVDYVNRTGDRAGGIRLATKLGLPAKAYQHEMDAAESNYQKTSAKAEADKAKGDQASEASEIRDMDGKVIGHAPTMGTRLNPEVAHADNRVGNAKALVGALTELKEDVAKNGNNLLPGSVKSRNRSALIANIQAAKRVAEALPASEGGLHLEEAQMPGSGQLIGLSTSPELIDKTISRIRDKVNAQNAAIIHDGKATAVPAAKAPAGGKADFKPRAPMMLKGVQYVEVGPDDWQPAK
jgi:hypothetical protein